MLAAMTYSVELFLMVICGLTIGHMVFNMSLPPTHSTDPCCNDDNDYDVENLKTPLSPSNTKSI
jgi:hypothetical protein